MQCRAAPPLPAPGFTQKDWAVFTINDRLAGQDCRDKLQSIRDYEAELFLLDK